MEGATTPAGYAYNDDDDDDDDDELLWIRPVALQLVTPLPRYAEALSDDTLRTSDDDDVCLVAYIGPKSRTERPRKIEIDTKTRQT